MISITADDIKNQFETLTNLSKHMTTLYLDTYVESLTNIYKKEPELPDFIKIPKSNAEMIVGDFEPSQVIDLREIKSNLKYGNLDMWRNPSNKEFSLHGFGLIEDNKSKPCKFTLYDTSPHLYIGGATGHGKSVTLNDLIILGCLVHPPWKVQYYLNDPKVVEFKPYGISKNILPHINSVASTYDPNYSISLLEYIIKIMQERNSIFVKARVKNITEFVHSTGLEMPMLILFLDECRSMYLNAGRLSAKIDNLLELFVSLARNAGGRCIMASQQIVEEMSKGTMSNINNRACLGCTSEVSTKVIGNSGASINYAKMGKITLNLKPSDGNIKDNIYLTSPFIPNESCEQSRTLYQIFDYVCDIWDKCNCKRLEPLSFYDDETPLTFEEFKRVAQSNISMQRIFLGEPSFIYKDKFKYFSFSLLPQSKYDSLLNSNILIMSPISLIRFNLTSLILFNLSELKKTNDVKINIFTNIRDTQDKIKSMGYDVDSYNYNMDVESHFYECVKKVMYLNVVCTADENIFDNCEIPESKFIDTIIKECNIQNMTDLTNKRIKFILSILSENKSKSIFNLPDPNESNKIIYCSYILSFLNLYKSFNCEHKQLKSHMLPIKFNVFINFDQLRGTEFKTLGSKLEMYFDVLAIAPIYGIYTIVVANNLVNSGQYLNNSFDNLIFYGVQGMPLNTFKIRDEYPEFVGSDVLVYINKKLSHDRCFKIKYPQIIKED